ncbi:MAG: Cytochrome c [Bacteroidetes bacterium]|nr:Cytochrome c [Bacteroidota bacterium]
MKINVLCIAVVVTAVLMSCAGTVPEPTLTHVEYASRRWPGTRLQDLSAGRQLYILKCSGCHSLHPPEELSGQQWEKTVPEMMMRARLMKEEADLIVRYLESASEVNKNVSK